MSLSERERGREREREREKKRERQKERQRQRERETHGDTQRHTETYRDTRRHTETHGDTQRHTKMFHIPHTYYHRPSHRTSWEDRHNTNIGLHIISSFFLLLAFLQFDKLRTPWEDGHVDIFVSRANLVQSCLTHFERIPAEDFKKTFRIRFDGEVSVVTYHGNDGCI
jgi:hypothetical protein